MSIGLMYGNHTFKLFKDNLEAINWLNKLSYEDSYADLRYVEMAFVDNNNLHKELYEGDREWKARCVRFFSNGIVTINKNQNIQDYLIP